MRILLVQNSVYVPAQGGANKSNRLLLEALSGMGHSCGVLASGNAVQGAGSREEFLRELAARGISIHRSTPDADVFRWNGVEVHAVRHPARMRPALIAQFRENEPDWIMVSSEDPGQTLLEAALECSPARVVYLARTTLALPFGPGAAIRSPRSAELLSRAAAILCVSEYVRDYIRRWAGYRSECLPISLHGSGPFPDYGNPDRGYVTMINPCAVKGLPIFLQLARVFPETHFAAVLSWGTTREDRAALEQLGNVILLPATDDVDQIYANTRVLLVPSLWAEAKARVVTEAMLRGIPVLASDVGGNPEAKLGVDYLLPVRPIENYGDRLDEKMMPIGEVPEQDVAPWSAALHELLSDAARYRRVSRDSREAAHRFVATHTVDKVERFLLRLEPRRLSGGCCKAPAAATEPESGELQSLIQALPPERRRLLTSLLLERERKVAPAPRASNGAGAAALLSPAQERLWFLHQLDPQSPVYNTKQAFRLHGPLRAPALARALNEIVRRHAVLRTSFPAEGGRPVAVVAKPSFAPLPTIDVTEVPPAERNAALERIALTAVKHPFHLENGPLLRFLLIRAGAEDHVLLLMAHHIVADAWSFGVFARELDAVYSAFARDQGSPLHDPSIQYADYGRWHRQLLQNGALAPQLSYWKRQLEDGIPPLRLPVEWPRPAVHNYHGLTHRFALPPATVDQLNALARNEGVSLYMLLLAAWQLVLHWHSGQEDFAIACPIASRNRTEWEGLIGFFVNTLAIRAKLHGNPSFKALLQRVRDTTLEAYAHQDLPFEKLIEELRPERNLGVNPLCQVLFVLQNVPPTVLRLEQLSLDPLELDNQTTRFDLEFLLSEQEGRISGRLVYSTALFSATASGAILSSYVAALREILRDPQQTLREIGAALHHNRAMELRLEDEAMRRNAVGKLKRTKRRVLAAGASHA